MRTYTYSIMKGTTEYLLTVQADDIEKAAAHVDALEPGENTSINLVDTQEGTLENYLGEETMERLSLTRRRARKEADNRRYKAKVRYTPAEGATRAKPRT